MFLVPKEKEHVRETKRKMAKLKHTQILYFCSDNGHISTEIVSTDIFKLKCRLHMPVYLFADAEDDVFVTCHYYLSTFFLDKNCIELCWETNIHTLYCGILFFLSECGRRSPGLHRVQLYMLWGGILKRYKTGWHKGPPGEMQHPNSKICQNLQVLRTHKLIFQKMFSQLNIT